MDLTLVGAVATGIAVFSGLMALLPAAKTEEPGLGERFAAWRTRRIEAARSQLAQARLDLRPESFLAISIVAPLVLGLLGLVLSVPMALVGLIAGAFVPRLYIRFLVAGEARAADDEAPRVLRSMVNRAAAGGTYPDLFAAAVEVARHRWVRADFEELLGRYYANEPLADALAAIRPRQAGRNLGLVFDALIVLAVTRQPAWVDDAWCPRPTTECAGEPVPTGQRRAASIPGGPGASVERIRGLAARVTAAARQLDAHRLARRRQDRTAR